MERIIVLKSNNVDKQQYYQKKIAPFEAEISELIKKESAIVAECRQDSTTAAGKLFLLSERMLNVTSHYLVLNGIGFSIFNMRDEESLGEARKFFSKALIYLENIVTGKVDAPFSEYEAGLAELTTINALQRCHLVKKLGLAISLLKIAYGDNTKWRWVFVDMEGHCAAVSKNLLDLKKLQTNTDPSNPDYEPLLYHAYLVKKMLADAADRFQSRYAISTKRSEDLNKAINFISALYRIHILLNERDEANEVKKKIDVWQNQLSSDAKK
ncbi:MAG: hypothetical protein LBB22_00065 [Treponema sp.]|jgi:hypothetical protein|nr:hypothetical protein [Treponema sp.]